MNSLKPLLTVAVLAGIGYGAYVRINRDSGAPPPAGVAAGWDATPKVQMPEVAMSPGGTAPWSGTPTSPPTAAPAFGGDRGMPAVSTPPREAPPYGAPAAQGAPEGSAPAWNQGGAPGEAPVPAYPPAAAPHDPASPGGTPFPPASEAANASAPPYSDTPPAEAVSPYDRYRDAPGAADAAPAPPAADPNAASFASSMTAARQQLEAGQLAAALRQLSLWYDNPQLTPTEQQQLNQLLDQVAGTVVYSTQHLLEAPYEVQNGERLEDISQRYNVPWQLLAKINGIDDPQSLRPGERLKVVRGPFAAHISLEKRELTLMLADGSYAGRFKIGIGVDQPPREGVYTVSDKAADPVYRGRDRAIGPRDPNNPLGDRWIGLGPEMGIHGTNRPETIGRADLPGSISLRSPDIEDVFDILSVGSKVTIRR